MSSVLPEAQKIGLAMIVRDAEDVVARCIESALPLISTWTVIDTGSVDKTREVVTAALKDVPGRLLESEWKGHAENRTELLAEARHDCEYVLQLDADMELVQEGDLPELTADSYLLTIHDRALVYPLPLLTKASLPFYYAGVAHAYLACHAPAGDSILLPELSIIDHGGGGNRPGKIERDRDLLAEAVGKDPLDRRSWFYLAQSYRDLDQIEQAIACYRMRASLGGWDEEVYYALYQAGVLLVENVSYAEGAKLLLQAWELRPGRAEALRALAGATSSVADKIPFPKDDLLFVSATAYKQPEPAQEPEPEVMPPRPSIKPGRKRRRKRGPLKVEQVSAVIVTRGNVDLSPILETLPFEETVIWDNSQRDHDYKAFGRFAAIPETTKPVLYWQDDDVIFTEYEQLLAAYEPGKAICNMDDPWVDACGYRDKVCMTGAGSLCDRHIPERVFNKYFARHPWDMDALVEADFIFGVLAPFKIIDIGYEAREFSDDPDRLYTQPWQPKRKWDMINRCLAMK